MSKQKDCSHSYLVAATWNEKMQYSNNSLPLWLLLSIGLLITDFALASASAAAAMTGTAARSRPKTITIHQFPNGTWLENLTQRPGGAILATELYSPRLWQVDPLKPADQVPVLVATAPRHTGLYGVVELENPSETYAFSTGNLSTSTSWPPFVRGSYSVYSIDLRGKHNPQDFPVQPRKLADFPEAGVLNGLTSLPASNRHPGGALLSADGIRGAIWILDLRTLRPEIWSQDPLLTSCRPQTQGVNGVKMIAHTQRVYFTNTGCQFVAFFDVDPQTGKPMGRAAIVGGRSQGLDVDDFDVSPRAGVAFVSDLYRNQILAVDLVSGASSSVAGSINSTVVAHPTAVWVGRTRDDTEHGTIYVTTTGGLPSGINGQVIGGQVLAINGAVRQSSTGY